MNAIKTRAVQRGLSQRQAVTMPYLGIDEKQFRKGHKTISNLVDLQQGRVLDGVEDRTEAACKALIEESLTPKQQQQVTGVALDMWKAYRNNEFFAKQFNELKQADLKVSRAWAIKARFRGFWDHRYAGWARRHFDKWYAWAIRSRLQPIKGKARMLKNHLPHILTYFKHRISNAVAEGLNSKIQTVKANASGYRSFDGFRSSILFYCGGLDMIS